MYICRIAASPMATHISRMQSRFSSFRTVPGCPSVSSCLGLQLEQHKCANSSWQLLSVLRPVGGKSLCPMKLQRAGDIFSRKN